MVLLNEFKAWPSSRQSLGQVPAEQPPGRALEQGGANSREEQRNPRRQICLENSSVSICWVRSCYRNCDDRGRAISWACLCVWREGGGRSYSSLNISCVCWWKVARNVETTAWLNLWSSKETWQLFSVLSKPWQRQVGSFQLNLALSLGSALSLLSPRVSLLG